MNLFGKWKEQATEYVDVRFQLAKLKFIERASHVIGNILLGFVLIATMMAVLLFFGIGIMETLVQWFEGNRIAAAFSTSAFFLLFIAAVLLLRKSILNALAGVFIRIMTDPGEDEEEEDRERKEQLEEEL